MHMQPGQINFLDKIKGSIVGMAIGDALGVHLEFKPKPKPGTPPITTYTAGNPYDIPKGYWTDDTSMALCIAQSLIDKKGYDPVDIMEKFVLWWSKGYMSSTGVNFDIGGTTRHALMEYRRDPSVGPYRGLTEHTAAGNGSIMRLAPIPLFFNYNINEAIHFADLSSKITHGYAECVDACKLMSNLIWRAMHNQELFVKTIQNDKEVFVLNCLSQIYDDSCKSIRNIIEGSFSKKNEEQIFGAGYVISSLEAALWAIAQSVDEKTPGEQFEKAIIKAVNLREDADTTGAVCGQIIGAVVGYDAIPQHFKDGLYGLDMLLKISEELYNASVEREEKRVSDLLKFLKGDDTK